MPGVIIGNFIIGVISIAYAVRSSRAKAKKATQEGYEPEFTSFKERQREDLK